MKKPLDTRHGSSRHVSRVDVHGRIIGQVVVGHGLLEARLDRVRDHLGHGARGLQDGLGQRSLPQPGLFVKAPIRLLAEMTGMSTATVLAARRDLEAAGHIQSAGAPSYYRLTKKIGITSCSPRTRRDR